MSNPIYTLEKLKMFLNTLTEEQLQQPVHIAFDDCPIQDLDGVEFVAEDVYVQTDDEENAGTLADLKAVADYDEEEFEIERFKVCTPKGTILFY